MGMSARLEVPTAMAMSGTPVLADRASAAQSAWTTTCNANDPGEGGR